MTNSTLLVSSFYNFTTLAELPAIKEKTLKFANKIGLKGTILLAHEGINASVSGNISQITEIYQYFASEYAIQINNAKENKADFIPFSKMKVKIKPEIVTMGFEGFDQANRGKYIAPNEWDEFISRPDVITIDTRNNYEVLLGTFENAVNPNTQNFKEFPKWANDNIKLFENRKVAMYCTGGIRCEKSTNYLKQLGVEEVYHLEGGILDYLEETENKNNKWHGNCFVFDDRLAVSDNLAPINSILCADCNSEVHVDLLQNSKNNNINKCINCRNE